jgi:hypothetical protein
MISAGASLVVFVPEMAEEPARNSQPTKVASERDRATTSHLSTLGLVLGGAGLVSLAGAGYFGALAFTKWDDVRTKCDPHACADARAADDASGARAAALTANILVGAGVVLVGVGLFIVLTGRGTNGSTPVRGSSGTFAPAF